VLGDIDFLSSKHRQLTSTLIAKRLLGILKGQPNFKVKSIMTMTSELFGYRSMGKHGGQSNGHGR
jgi:hypothetical protein